MTTQDYIEITKFLERNKYNEQFPYGSFTKLMEEYKENTSRLLRIWGLLHGTIGMTGRYAYVVGRARILSSGGN